MAVNTYICRKGDKTGHFGFEREGGKKTPLKQEIIKEHTLNISWRK